MKLAGKKFPWTLALVLAAVSVGLVGWQTRQPSTNNHEVRSYSDVDTVPAKQRDRKIRDLDEALDELNRVDISKEMLRAQEEVAAAMAKIDLEKIRVDIDKALKEVDIDKIRADVQESMAKIDWDQIKAEIEEAKKIDMPKLEAEMANLKKELEKLGPEIKKQLAQAQVEIDNAKAEIKEYKSFVDGLEKDGLINKKEGYTLKLKGGELFINGKKASPETYNKYRSFLEKHKSFTIEKSDDDFNIHRD